MSAVRCAACGAVAGTPKKRHNGTFSQLSTVALPRCILPHKSDTAETWQRYCKRKISMHARKHGDEAEDVQVLIRNKLFVLTFVIMLTKAMDVGSRRMGGTGLC